MKNMAIFYLTPNGAKLAEKINCHWDADVYGKKDFADGFINFVSEKFFCYQSLIFIMATGIVVRSIAPALKKKTIDPAVVVLDEKGEFVISLLSGHLGGANQLAKDIANSIGGQAVITTATDVNHVIAFDVFAKKNQMQIENIEELKYISSALVNGKKVGFFSDSEPEDLPSYLLYQTQLDENVLISNKLKEETMLQGHVLKLIPKNLTLGIGCKKNTSLEEIEIAVADFFKKSNRKVAALSCVSSIDLKKEEQGIVAFCKKKGLPFITLSRERLLEVESEFSYSDFVKKTVGVGNVCEACAKYAVKNSRLIYEKTTYSGITLSLGEIMNMYLFI